MAAHGEIRRPPVGSFSGRLRGDSHGRRHQHLTLLTDVQPRVASPMAFWALLEAERRETE